MTEILPQGNRGRYEDRVEFTFELPSQNNKQFVITRAVKGTVNVEAHQQQLAPTAPYTRPKRRPRGFKDSITDGTRPSNFERQKTAFRYPLPDSKIPADVVAIVQHGPVDTKVERIREEKLPAEVQSSTYADHWQTLLWLEEFQAELVDIPKMAVLLDNQSHFKEGYGALRSSGRSVWRPIWTKFLVRLTTLGPLLKLTLTSRRRKPTL